MSANTASQTIRYEICRTRLISEFRKLRIKLQAPILKVDDGARIALHRNLGLMEEFASNAATALQDKGSFLVLLKEIAAVRTLAYGGAYDDALPLLHRDLLLALEYAVTEDAN